MCSYGSPDAAAHHRVRRGWADFIGPDPFHVRIGINTGYCAVGNFGSEDRLDYTIVGGAVNVASRLVEAASPDQILISHTTYALIKDELYCRSVGDLQLKGIGPNKRTNEVVGEYEGRGQHRRCLWILQPVA